MKITAAALQHGRPSPLKSKLFDAAEFKLLHECKILENCKKGAWREFVVSFGKYCSTKDYKLRKKSKVLTANLWGAIKKRVHTGKTWEQEISQKIVGHRLAEYKHGLTLLRFLVNTSGRGLCKSFQNKSLPKCKLTLIFWPPEQLHVCAVDLYAPYPPICGTFAVEMAREMLQGKTRQVCVNFANVHQVDF